MTDFYFKIFNTTWTVSFIDSFNDEDKNDVLRLGDTNNETKQIRIATKTGDGGFLPESTVRLTLLHEMIHAILDTGQYCNYSSDEPCVEWLANCLYSIKEQNKL